ncbi:gamma-glutamyltransferase [Microbulbifer sp. SH-1]|uniref:gamma-glutamyltransferase family protein n=1 Tax=Microbulbifer sp. SH-1 TaxID=2681547 RepID=UPI00140901CF|nr:gamma-glutamyltransferase [Microbulbifer sp. SH-1]QIL88480.1 gamma-glutamyltransferase [Microbulbifer sp. SH-1]
MTHIAFTAPHFKATEAGMEILRRGGSAVDAMVAAAAAVAVHYPHMNSLGGDGFWLIQRKGEAPVAIDAAGCAAASVDPQWTPPYRGVGAAFTSAGTVAGWEVARTYIGQFTQLEPLETLFAEARRGCESGIEVTDSLATVLRKYEGCKDIRQLYYPDGKLPSVGARLCNPRLGQLFERLAAEGLDGFYRGTLAEDIGAALECAGSLLRATDFYDYRARLQSPLSVQTSHAQLFNLGAPTQGIASLLTLAIYDQLYEASWSELQRVHHLIEATKQAFRVRDREVADPACLSEQWDQLLQPGYIRGLAAEIRGDRAQPWGKVAEPGDTVWMGALDGDGTLVSFIQSIYWEFGSGLVLPELGLVWNNRGLGFSRDPSSRNCLAPGKKPFHTLNPAMANFADGGRAAYGTMGGEGQPQTQAAIFTRRFYQGLPLADAIAESRWLLGRTWGEASVNLKMEQALYQRIGPQLAALGHEIRPVLNCNGMMGHAGGIYIDASGRVECATDPRSDGLALCETLG